MLSRRIGALLIFGAFLLVSIAIAPAAIAACSVDEATGQVVCDEETPGGGGGGGGGGGASATCQYAGKEIPCSGPDGASWSSAHQCYVGEVQPEATVPPPGQTAQDGSWHVCYFPPPGSSFELVWIKNGEVAIDPIVLARRAIASMDLDPITIGIVPEPGENQMGIVGMPVWMWVANPTDDTYGPITASASQGPVSVSATASVSSIVWDMGDGHSITCDDKGTPYADRYGDQDSPTCGYRYDQMSTDQSGGVYRVTATSHWVVDWAGGGQTGAIEFDLVTAPLALRVGEAQVLTQ